MAGLRWKIVLPGTGVVSMNTGTEIIDLETDMPVFKSGPTGELTVLCRSTIVDTPSSDEAAASAATGLRAV